MSVPGVNACLDDITSAYDDGNNVIQKIKNRRTRKDLPPPSIAALEESLTRSPWEIRTKAESIIATLGPTQDAGRASLDVVDGTTLERLRQIKIDLMAGVFEQLVYALTTDDFVDFSRIVGASELGRMHTIHVLLGLEQTLVGDQQPVSHDDHPVHVSTRPSVSSLASSQPPILHPAMGQEAVSSVGSIERQDSSASLSQQSTTRTDSLHDYMQDYQPQWYEPTRPKLDHLRSISEQSTGYPSVIHSPPPPSSSVPRSMPREPEPFQPMPRQARSSLPKHIPIMPDEPPSFTFEPFRKPGFGRSSSMDSFARSFMTANSSSSKKSLWHKRRPSFDFKSLSSRFPNRLPRFSLGRRNRSKSDALVTTSTFAPSPVVRPDVRAISRMESVPRV